MAFFLIFSSFLAIVYFYTGLRLIPSLFKGKKALFAWIILLAFWAGLILHIYLLVSFILPDLSKILAWIGYSGLGLMSYLFCLTIDRDLIFIPWAVIETTKRFFSSKDEPPLISSKRRQFLYTASSYGIVMLGLPLTGIGAYFALQKPRVVHIDISLKPDMKGLKGLTLVQFSDLHIGPTIGYTYVKQVCDIIQDLEADIITFTGDLVDGTPENLAKDIAPLKDLTAPLGKYFVTGNHEYYSGVNRWIEQARLLGYDPLLNEHRVIEYNAGRLTLAGVNDIRAGSFSTAHRSRPKKALRGAPKDSYKLLLAHQPTSVYEAANLGVDLQLSGHTHGGQYYPIEYAVQMLHPFVKGMYQHKNTQIYVNQGTGYWGPPLRLGTFPEITLFTFI